MIEKIGLYLKNRIFDLYTLKMVAYLIALIIFIGSTVLFSIYRISVSKIENVSLKLSEMKLKEIKNIVDSYIRQADSIAISMSMDKDVYSLTGMDYLSAVDKINRVISVADRFKNLANSNEMLHSIYAYYKKPACVICDTLYPADEVEDLKFIDDEKISTIGLNITKNEDTMISPYRDRNTRDVLKIVRNLFTVEEAGYVVVNIDVAAVVSKINEMKLFSNEQIFILDDNKNPVMATTDQIDLILETKDGKNSLTEINSKKYVKVGESSNFTNWSYVSLVPVESIYDNYKTINRYTKILFVVMLILGCFFSIIVAAMILKPINVLYNGVIKKSSVETEKDKIKHLSRVYERVFNDNENLMGIIEKNRPILKEKILLNLLMNSEKSELDLKNRMEYASINLPYNLFLVAAVEIEINMHGNNEYEYLKMELCRKYLENSFEKLCKNYVVQFEPYKIAVILNYNEQNCSLKLVFQAFSNIIKELKRRLQTNISIGISMEGNELLSVNLLFFQSLKCLEQKFIMGKNEVIYFENIEYPTSSFQAYVYPFDIEQSLINEIKLCNIKNIKSILSQIKEYVHKIPQENRFIHHQFFIYLINNITQSFYNLSAGGNLQGFDIYSLARSREELESISDYMDYIENLCMYIVHYMDARRENKNKELVERILKYIEENYSKNITVEDIASSAYISVPYLYKLLKEEKNLSPFSYLSYVRVNNAVIALKDMNRQVKDISYECGFENVQSFYRQFKKLMNYSPTEYRRLMFGDEKPDSK